MAWRHVSSVAGLAVVAALLTPTLWLRSPSEAADPGPDRLREIAAGAHRAKDNSVRDTYRKPVDVITFLGIRPDSKVIEISPGSAGYWTEILAPYLKDRGLYVAANPAPTSS